MHAADVDAAQEGGVPVDDQQLAVVAPVPAPVVARGQRVDGVELVQLHAAGGQPFEEGGRRAEGAGAVAQQVDLHALRLLGHQRLGKALAHLVVVEDVGLEVDVVARGLDGREHGPVGGRPVLQQQHLVAGGQRAADQGLFEREVALEDTGGRAARRQAVEDGAAARHRQRATRALQLHRRAGRLRQVGHDARQAAAADATAQGQHRQHHAVAQAQRAAWRWRHRRAGGGVSVRRR